MLGRWCISSWWLTLIVDCHLYFRAICVAGQYGAFLSRNLAPVLYDKESHLCIHRSRSYRCMTSESASRCPATANKYLAAGALCQPHSRASHLKPCRLELSLRSILRVLTASDAVLCFSLVRDQRRPTSPRSAVVSPSVYLTIQSLRSESVQMSGKHVQYDHPSISDCGHSLRIGGLESALHALPRHPRQTALHSERHLASVFFVK